MLSPADDIYHIDKTKFKVPFVCGARDLGEALRRIAEGSFYDTYEGGTGNRGCCAGCTAYEGNECGDTKDSESPDDELFEAAEQLQVPVDLLIICS